jgi:hypothetical protein
MFRPGYIECGRPNGILMAAADVRRRTALLRAHSMLVGLVVGAKAATREWRHRLWSRRSPSNDFRSAARPRGTAATEGLVSCNGLVRQHSHVQLSAPRADRKRSRLASGAAVGWRSLAILGQRVRALTTEEPRCRLSHGRLTGSRRDRRRASRNAVAVDTFARVRKAAPVVLRHMEQWQFTTRPSGSSISYSISPQRQLPFALIARLG